MKKLRWQYNYETLKDGQRQYDDFDFNYENSVNAKYVPADLYIDRGNPFVEALPLPRNSKEVNRVYDIPLYDFDRDKIKLMSDSQRKRSISQLRQLRFALPFHMELEERFYEALVNSYRARYICYNSEANIPVSIGQKEVCLHSKTFGESGDAATSGFSLLGYSGCGKSSSLKILLNHYPQVIFHHPDEHTQIPQIVYLVVNCIPNSNFSSLYSGIAAAIDRALGNMEPIYENMILKIKNLGAKSEKIRELIEIFSIGIILIDEIQLMDFSSNRESSYESLMVLNNRTKVAIGVIGTEDAYDIMFSKLRTVRRTGPCISANSYCSSREFFDRTVDRLFAYQWTDKLLIPNKKIKDSLFDLSKGIIDQLISIYIFIQLDYITKKKNTELSPNFIEKTVNTHYPGLQTILNSADLTLIEKQRIKILKKANEEVNKAFCSQSQEYNENLLNDDDEIRKYIQKNVINNIHRNYNQFDDDSIINAYNKVMNIKENQNKNESEITDLTVKMLLNTSKKKRTEKKLDPIISTEEMEKYITY